MFPTNTLKRDKMEILDNFSNIPSNFTGMVKSKFTKVIAYFSNGKYHKIDGPAIVDDKHKHYVELLKMGYPEHVIIWLVKNK